MTSLVSSYYVHFLFSPCYKINGLQKYLLYHLSEVFEFSIGLFCWIVCVCVCLCVCVYDHSVAPNHA